VPLGRIAGPDEIGAAVAFLADERMPTLVGQILHANGGTTRARA
jgi:NAD(P)-dependent dehydrogenase (short-subunit alcohol dehydrogenase family)